MLELAGIVILGIVAQWMAWRLKLPAILPLILIGLLVGPISTLFTEDGTKLIEPIWNGNKGLFPGEGLYSFVSLAISVILFEGGLTLKRAEIANVGRVITKLITVGALVTFFGAGIAAHYIFGLSWQISFLFAGLIIVTGPTVITPILRNIPLKKDVSTVLKWEGILIDPIGALVAVLVFEFISVGQGEAFTVTALIEFGKILLFGFSFGFTFAHALAFAIKRNFIPHYLLNVVSLSAVLLVYVESDIFAHESGLLAVVVMGLVMGHTNLPNIKELLYFKESLSVLLISILFILLAANIDINDMMLIANWNTAILFAIVVLIIRPLGVFISAKGSHLKFNERIFISWVGPRGIVAAGIASLLGSKLLDKGESGAEYITPLVFMVVLGTVLLNATTARLVAKWARVFLKKSDGVLIIGISKLSLLIATYLKQNNRHVVLIDNNPRKVEKAQNLELDAITASIYSGTLTDDIELNDMGYLLSLTGNLDTDMFAIEKFRKQFGENGAFRLRSAEEMPLPENSTQKALFSHAYDFTHAMHIVRKYPAIHEIDLKDEQHYRSLIEITEEKRDVIPIFTKAQDGELAIIAPNGKTLEPKGKGYKLVYLGRSLEVDSNDNA